MKVEGVVERRLILPFRRTEIGIIECMAPKWRPERMQDVIDKIE